MKRNAKKISLFMAVVLVLSTMLTFLSGCGEKKERVVIYSSTEDYGIELIQNMLDEKFPEYEIVVEYMSTGDHAAKLLSEGADSEADITHDIEYGYLLKLEQAGVLADVSNIKAPEYCEELMVSKNYYPEVRSGGAIIINPKVLADRKLSKPTCYEDLLKPEYKDLISMPNPKSSGTGYMFLKSLVNSWGEDRAFSYFDDLTNNILQYTSSGSGPVNALIQGEVAIGLGMTAQAVSAVNDGTDLEICFFEEGSPYSVYGQGIVKGKEERECVVKVFEYLVNSASVENAKLYHPEKILQDKDFEVKNFPKDIKYADMKNNTFEEKERLLSKWKY
ncbi:MAG: extracellular solute-binding protein [Oscillospiraceae bacterium]|nr:extracellular solute-binding protein [Oscillospiraceae bacterium]